MAQGWRLPRHGQWKSRGIGQGLVESDRDGSTGSTHSVEEAPRSPDRVSAAERGRSCGNFRSAASVEPAKGTAQRGESVLSKVTKRENTEGATRITVASRAGLSWKRKVRALGLSDEMNELESTADEVSLSRPICAAPWHRLASLRHHPSVMSTYGNVQRGHKENLQTWCEIHPPVLSDC